MKVTFIILSAAVFYAHVARGLPADTKKGNPSNDPAPAAAPVAPSNDPAPAAAPAADKPDSCTASINGQQQTLQPGDRYCSDDTTSRVCNWGGEFIDQKCDPGSKCIKADKEWKVLCRIVNKNPPQNAPPQDSDVQPNPKSPETPSNPPPAPKPQVDSAPPPPPPPPQPEPTKQDNPKVDSAPPPPAPPPSQPEPPKQETTQAAPTTTDTCKATVDGTEQTLQSGDRYCLDDNTNRVCDSGKFVDFPCPTGSKCLKSPNKWEVLCRIINKNPPQNAP